MSITNNLVAFEAVDTGSVGQFFLGGGGTPSLDNEIIIAGTQAFGRRVTATTTPGNGVGPTTTAKDLTAAGTHIGVWLWITQVGILSSWGVVLSDQNSRTQINANYLIRTISTLDYPAEAGWQKIWIDVNNTTFDITNGTVSLASLQFCGHTAWFTGTPGGNAPNVWIDKIDYTNGTQAALIATGTSPVNTFDDFVTLDVGASNVNQYGVFRERNGIYNCLGRIALSDSAAQTTFTDSGFNIAFIPQAYISDSFLGINVDLTTAKTNVQLSNGSIFSTGATPSGVTKSGDFVVTGTGSGASLSINACSLLDLRIITLNSLSTVDGGELRAIDITQGSALIKNCRISTQSLANNATITDPTFGISTGINNVDFVQDGTGHALELDTATTYTFTNITFSNYGGTDGSNETPNSGATDAAVLNSSGGAITINVTGGTSPSIRNTAGSTTIVISTVSLRINNIVANSELRIYNTDTDQELSGVETIGVTTPTNGTVTPVGNRYSYTYDYNQADAPINAKIVVMNIQGDGNSTTGFQHLVQELVLDADGVETVISQIQDRNYINR